MNKQTKQPSGWVELTLPDDERTISIKHDYSSVCIVLSHLYTNGEWDNDTYWPDLVFSFWDFDGEVNLSTVQIKTLSTESMKVLNALPINAYAFSTVAVVMAALLNLGYVEPTDALLKQWERKFKR